MGEAVALVAGHPLSLVFRLRPTVSLSGKSLGSYLVMGTGHPQFTTAMACGYSGVRRLRPSKPLTTIASHARILTQGIQLGNAVALVAGHPLFVFPSGAGCVVFESEDMLLRWSQAISLQHVEKSMTPNLLGLMYWVPPVYH